MVRTSTSDLKTLQELMMWARDKRIALTQVQVGSIAIVGHDRGLDAEFVGPGPHRDEAKKSIIEEYAGGALSDIANGHGEEGEPVIEDDE